MFGAGSVVIEILLTIVIFAGLFFDFFSFCFISISKEFYDKIDYVLLLSRL
jgi:hypothetical protein